MSLRKALSLFHLCIYSNSKSIFLHIKCDGKVMSLLKSGWVICHCGKGLTLSPSQRLFFFSTILLSCIISCYFACMVGEQVDVLVLCKEMMGDPGPKGWNGGEAEWEAERQVLCRQLCRSVTALGRCYTLLSYIRLIDPDFSVYTRARMVSSKLGRKRKQAVVSMAGRLTRFSFELQLSRWAPLLFPAQGSGDTAYQTHRAC